MEQQANLDNIKKIAEEELSAERWVYETNNSFGEPVLIYSSRRTDENNKNKHWAKLFDRYYNKIDSDESAYKDTSIWRSSYDGKPIPGFEIEEWIDTTVEKLKPYLNEAKEVLEIGCGNGLIFGKIHHLIKSYTGLDSSEAALKCIRESDIYKKCPSKFSLELLGADKITQLLPKKYDIIIINSVMQYFPDSIYFHTVLSDMQNVLNENGVVFMGDLRSKALADFQYKHIASKNCKDENHEELLIKKYQRRENEMLISPLFISQLINIHDWINSTSVSIKFGASKNEMMRFRYDAFLFNSENITPQTSKDSVKEYTIADLSNDKLDEEIQNTNKICMIKGIPNPHLADLPISANSIPGHTDTSANNLLMKLKTYLTNPNVYMNIYESNNPSNLNLSFSNKPFTDPTLFEKIKLNEITNKLSPTKMTFSKYNLDIHILEITDKYWPLLNSKILI